MAKYLVCAMRDAAIGAFAAPLIFRSKGECVRSFMDAVSDSSTPMSKHPCDYAMFQLGWYDDIAGMLEPLLQVELIITAMECIQSGVREEMKNGGALYSGPGTPELRNV